MALKVLRHAGREVTAFDDAALYSGIINGKAEYGVVLPIGEQCRYEIISNNEIRVYDGIFVLQGHEMQIEPNTYETFAIENGEQGVVRYDAIGFMYSKENGGSTIVVKDVENSTSEQGNLWAGSDTAYGALYLVKINGLTIEEVTQAFVLAPCMAQAGLAAYPVGSIYISTASTNPLYVFGGGTWERFANGRVLVGVDASQSEFSAASKTGGAKTHTHTQKDTGGLALSLAQIPQHFHKLTRKLAVVFGTNGATLTAYGNSEQFDEVNSGPAGGGEAHSHTNPDTDAASSLPPYITVYMWKRTA